MRRFGDDRDEIDVQRREHLFEIVRAQSGPWVISVAWVRAGGELLLPIGSLFT